MSGAIDDVANNIKNEQRTHGIDRNPTLKCEICEVGKSWRSYWKWRINTPADRFICDECLEKAVEMHDRMTKNQSLKIYIANL